MRTLLFLMASLVIAGCSSMGANRPSPLTVDEVVQLSKQGVPADQIIKRMKASGAVYELPASRLAKLHNRGVPDQVIDYMNSTQIDAARRDEDLVQRDRWLMGYGPWYGPWGYGPWGPYWP